MRLEFTSYDSPVNLFLDTPFRDGFANIKAAFQESNNIYYEGLNTQNVRVSEEVPDRTLADKIKLVFVGVILLVPVINIVIDLAMRFFCDVKKDEKDNFYQVHVNSRGRDVLEGLNTNRILGGENGLHQALDNVISPRIVSMMRNGSFQYAISPQSQGEAVTGSLSYVLHLRINQDGKSIEWRRKIVESMTAENDIYASEREIARDVLSKLYDINKI